VDFKLKSDFEPTGDQPAAIKQLIGGLESGESAQVLLGATGTGKTFTMANVIAQSKKPILVLSHNKTLAAQLYGEFKAFFPENSVEYFISYYDYYQPEAYLSVNNLYIEKDLSINEEIEKLRLSTTSSLLSGRRDVIVVASVSCIYGIGNPDEFGKNVLPLKVGQLMSQKEVLLSLVDIIYARSHGEFKRGTFRVQGDTVDIFVAYADFAYRLIFWGDEIESIQRIDPESGRKISEEESITIFPANLFVTSKETVDASLLEMAEDLEAQVSLFESERRFLEAKRIRERTEFDMEMINELGYCSGIENYSRYFDRRKAGQRPFCLLDYFPDDYLMMIDESHATLPQVRAMWGGDRSRKESLVDFGFRLPAALDNRPLSFNEFESMINQVIYLSATPGDYELRNAEGVIVEQIIRPTGLLDPIIEVRSSKGQIDDLLEEIDNVIKAGDRVLVTTLTKRMAEEMFKFFSRLDIKARYIHSEVKTLDRTEILRDLRMGVIDVLVGVNLLREGLDLPEVSLVAIMDADKEGFLRNHRSLIQTVGRAARNIRGRVLMYGDKLTDSMKLAIEETNRRRKIQEEYNIENHIVPKTVEKSTESIMEQTSVADKRKVVKIYRENDKPSLAADPVVKFMPRPELEKLAEKTRKEMEQASSKLDFIEAARLRDEWYELKDLINKS
jgi:excinuclease ABC subunit B